MRRFLLFAGVALLAFLLWRLGPAEILGLLRRVGVEQELTFTGGVARNVGMVHVLNESLGLQVNVSEESHYMGAIGAALFALDYVLGSRVPLRAGEAAA